MQIFMRPVGSQSVAVSTANARSAALSSTARAVRLSATADVYVLFGSGNATPTATTSNGMLIRASTAGEVFKCQPGEVIAAITSSGTGTLNITEMTA